MWKKYLVYLFGLFIVITACDSRSASVVSCEKLIDTIRPVEIRNRGNEAVVFSLKWNGSFANFDSVLSEIKQLPDDFLNEPLERKSWRFVIKHMDFFRNPLQSSEIHHPLVLLNSLGYGQCDDLATLLYFIWKKQGFNARIWSLGKHVVPEVFNNGKWQMYDPAFHVYYLNRTGRPASVEELTADNQLILNPLKTITINEKNNMDPSILDSLRYGMSVCQHYLSDKEHFENKFYYNTFDINEFMMQIPPGANVTIPVYEPGLLIQTDWILQQDRNNNYYLKLKIPAHSHGIIKIPLILTAVEGDIILKSAADKNRIYAFSGERSTHLEIIDTCLYITGTNKDAQLYYKLPETFKNTIPLSIGFTKNHWSDIVITQKKH